ncbi:MAG: siderophore-interacting protein [Renibacterium salmoninarum]|jgi:iron complex transport system ATP-binding protein|uniref:siderophore-interacting protein n=1 Tax=Arthrobacter russicus TaxID=172040 RepID=UPI00264E3F6C|nr:siderophore-interacting protein [Renibacterium salmoninarum]
MSASAVTVRPIRSFDVEVVGVQALGPSFKRITFASDEVRSMGSGADGKTLDLRIKVMIPSAGRSLPDFSALMEMPAMTWYQAWLDMDEASRGFMRTYTVRQLRAESGEVDVDFVLHPPAGGGKAGPASSWAEGVRLGDRVVLIGPNAQAGPCSGIEFTPGTSRRILLVGDETAVPAIASILESLDPETVGHAIIEVPRAADFQDLVAPAGVDIQWIARGGRPHGAQLDAAVRLACLPGSHVDPQAEAVELEDVDVDEVILWETPAQQGVQPNGQLYAWIAGEAAVIRELRRYLVREVGMDRRQVAFMGYWRIGKSEDA